MYPTPKEILAKNPKIQKKIIEATLEWKKEFLIDWKKKSNNQKIERIAYLLTKICEAISFQQPNLIIMDAEEYAYKSKQKIIYLDENNPSIISALHELGHHIYGKSELKACIFSVWLFKECFPGLYSKLKWNKDDNSPHLLIKQ